MTGVRNILFYLMTIGSISLLTGCSRSDVPIPPGPPTPPDPDPDPPAAAVPIRLKTQLLSRAAIENFDSTALNVAKGSGTLQFDEIWEAVATDSEITFVPERYYPADSSDVYLTGYYPKGAVKDGLVEYHLDGETDIITTKAQSGSLVNPFDKQDSLFSFSHQLSLLKITVRLAENRPETYYLKFAGLEGSSREAWLELSSGELLFGTEAPKLVLYEAETETGIEISTESTFNSSLLVQPHTELTVDIVLTRDNNPEHDLSYTGLPVHFEGSGSEGNVAYNIDIVIGSPDLPIGPDTPDVPDPPTPPDIPDDPDEPDIPIPPVIPPVVPPASNPSITITATVTSWEEVSGGNIDFRPSNE